MTAKKRGRPRNPDTPVRITTKDLLARLEQHEAICAVKLEAIEKRHDSGSDKFKFQQNTIWGLYGAIFVTFIAGKFF
jgi:hypothetical protein